MRTPGHRALVARAVGSGGAFGVRDGNTTSPSRGSFAVAGWKNHVAFRRMRSAAGDRTTVLVIYSARASILGSRLWGNPAVRLTQVQRSVISQGPHEPAVFTLGPKQQRRLATFSPLCRNRTWAHREELLEKMPPLSSRMTGRSPFDCRFRRARELREQHFGASLHGACAMGLRLWEHAPISVVYAGPQCAARFVVRRFRSVLAPDGGRFRTHPIDDASTDDSATVIAEFAIPYSLPRSDVPSMLPERAILPPEARGEFVAFLDADIWPGLIVLNPIEGVARAARNQRRWFFVESIDERGHVCGYGFVKELPPEEIAPYCCLKTFALSGVHGASRTCRLPAQFAPAEDYDLWPGSPRDRICSSSPSISPAIGHMLLE